MKRILLGLMLLIPALASAQHDDYERLSEKSAFFDYTISSFIDRHPLITLLILIILFVIQVIIIRAIFGIPKILHQLEAQSKLLALMAEKQGVDSRAIRRATEKDGNSSNPFDVRK